MQVRVVKKADIQVGRLAKLTCLAMKRDHVLAADTSEEEFIDKLSEGIARYGYDWMFIARNNGRIVGWLALYELSDLGIAQMRITLARH